MSYLSIQVLQRNIRLRKCIHKIYVMIMPILIMIWWYKTYGQYMWTININIELKYKLSGLFETYLEDKNKLSFTHYKSRVQKIEERYEDTKFQLKFPDSDILDLQIHSFFIHNTKKVEFLWYRLGYIFISLFIGLILAWKFSTNVYDKNYHFFMPERFCRPSL